MFSIVLNKNKYSFVCDTDDNDKFRKYIQQSTDESIERMVQSIKETHTVKQPLHINFLDSYFMTNPFYFFRFAQFLSSSSFPKNFYSSKE
jgi:hypothetical protein